MHVVIAVALIACSSPQPAAGPPATTVPATERTVTSPPTPATTAPASVATRAPGAVHYVAIGASDTVGVGALDPARGSWPSRIAALLPSGATYKNLGVSGSLTAQALTEQLPAAVRERPTVVSIWLAVNDMNAGVTPQDHSAALGRIVDGLVAGTTARVFIGTVPDLRAVPVYSGTDPDQLIALVNAYNAGIRAVGARHPQRVVVVDLFTGSADLMTDVTVASDGFHPSDAGYVLIAERFARAMREAGVPLRAS